MLVSKLVQPSIFCTGPVRGRFHSSTLPVRPLPLAEPFDGLDVAVSRETRRLLFSKFFSRSLQDESSCSEAIPKDNCAVASTGLVSGSVATLRTSCISGLVKSLEVSRVVTATQTSGTLAPERVLTICASRSRAQTAVAVVDRDESTGEPLLQLCLKDLL